MVADGYSDPSIVSEDILLQYARHVGDRTGYVEQRPHRGMPVVGKRQRDRHVRSAVRVVNRRLRQFIRVERVGNGLENRAGRIGLGFADHLLVAGEVVRVDGLVCRHVIIQYSRYCCSVER